MKNKKKYKKPNWFIYKIFYLASKLVSKVKLNLKVLRNETKEEKGSLEKVYSNKFSGGENLSNFHHINCGN